MSQIPFVNLLGDELERAAERAARKPRRWVGLRLGPLAVTGAVLVSGTALAAGVLSGDVERQAVEQIACYDGADPDFSGSVAVLAPEAGTTASPVSLCRDALSFDGRPAPPLVACADEAHVAVIPGRGPDACMAAGFAALDRGYVQTRARAAKLERRILAIERSADCVPPDELARRVQQLFRRSGWVGWTASVRPNATAGPCGSVSAIGGDGRRYIAGLLDAESRQVPVAHSGSRRVTDLLHARGRSLLVALFEESGASCLGFDGLARRIRQVFGAKGVDAAVERESLAPNTALDDQDGRWSRYREGCAIVAGGEAGPEPSSVVVAVYDGAETSQTER